MAETKTVTEASFSSDVLSSEKPVLVDFWAAWCGPCRMVSPIVDEIAAEHSDTLSVAKVNVDDNPGLAQQYGVMSIPMLAVFSGGKVVKTIIGAKPKAALLRDLAPYV